MARATDAVPTQEVSVTGGEAREGPRRCSSPVCLLRISTAVYRANPVMNADVINQRKSAVLKLMAGAKAVIDFQGLTRSSLVNILARLQELAAKRPYWDADSYPAAKRESFSVLYKIADDPTRGFALYIEVACPGNKVPPHNHMTWACIAAVEGRVDNILYRREDHASGPGQARLAETRRIVVEPGRGIALMPDDIHAITNSSPNTARHLLFYGQAIETLTTRLQFNLEKQTASTMAPVVISGV
jgi:predicted metal-dependent enzyme (double-stranded beta helix superfamily)